jgi:serine/threonine-protein kinase
VAAVTDYLRDRVVGAVGSHYQIEGEVGRGGMAVVYRARDAQLHRPVAIKVLPPDVAFNADVRTRFIREAQTAAQLNHPNIVSIYSVDDSDPGLVYFVMAFVEGESLGVRLANEGRWPIERTVQVLRDVADALAYAHARGVVHRDIKPDNILIERATGRAIVTDFGIARAAAGDTRLTVTGVAVGTPAYMSPEQAMGEREVDGRSDLYSLAVVGYHMLSGETPFKAANTPAMLVKHVSERPRPIRELRPEVPRYLAVAIDRALAKRPEDRWSGAGEFRDALDAATDPQRSRRYRSPSPAIPMVPAVQSPVIPLVQDIGRDVAALGQSALANAGSPFGASFPPPPPGLDRAEVRQWYRTQRRLWWAQQMQGQGANTGLVVGRTLYPFRKYDDRPLEDRVAAFRRSVLTWIACTGILFGINAANGGVPWFIFPSGVLFIGVARRLSSIWSDGIGPIDAFKKGLRKKLRAEREQAAIASGEMAPPPVRAQLSPDQLASQLAPADVLAGAHGEVVRRAAVDRALMRDIMGALKPVERDMIPDIGPTVDALAQRVGALATTLHRLDADVSGASLGSLDERIAGLATEPETAERERRLALLTRQRSSLHDLLERRRTLANQLESAGLMLQNLKFDMLKFRSTGLGSQFEESTSATQEARALSREIGHVVEAAEELKKL